MSAQTQAILGFIALALGWLLGRWASHYDVKSWFTDAMRRGVWGLFKSGAWRKPSEISLKDVVSTDPVLTKQLNEKIADLKADAARIGSTRTAVKHGGMHVLAYLVSLISGPLTIIGILVLAHAAYRWLS